MIEGALSTASAHGVVLENNSGRGKAISSGGDRLFLKNCLRYAV